MLQAEQFYHIYNSGVNGCDLFADPKDYEHFLQLYDRFISPVADTFAWVLMGNHFHVLVCIKGNVVYRNSKSDKQISPEKFEELKWETCDFIPDKANHKQAKPDALRHFSHFFNAYAKYFNTRHNRRGVLFERAFKRKLVDSETYFRRLVLYIHNNPVHHGFCQHPLEYAWSSYLTCVSEKPTKLKRKEVLSWFENKDNFKRIHDEPLKIVEIENWLEEGD